MVTSFFLAKKFHQKTYVFLSAVIIALISLFSVGLPYRESSASSYWPLRYTSGIVIRYPLPLSFPFYAFINHTLQPSYPSPNQMLLEIYQIEFLTLQLPQSLPRTLIYQNQTWTPQNLMIFYADWGDYFLYYTFFFSLNLVGAIVGYWIGKPPLAIFLKGNIVLMGRRVHSIISSSLEKVSLKILITSFLLLTGVDIAQTILVFPEYEAGLLAKAFIVFFGSWALLYFPVRIVFTLMIVILVHHHAPPQLSKKLFAVLSSMTLAMVIYNACSLAVWLSSKA